MGAVDGAKAGGSCGCGRDSERRCRSTNSVCDSAGRLKIHRASRLDDLERSVRQTSGQERCPPRRASWTSRAKVVKVLDRIHNNGGSLVVAALQFQQSGGDVLVRNNSSRKFVRDEKRERSIWPFAGKRTGGERRPPALQVRSNSSFEVSNSAHWAIGARTASCISDIERDTFSG